MSDVDKKSKGLKPTFLNSSDRYLHGENTYLIECFVYTDELIKLFI